MITVTESEIIAVPRTRRRNSQCLLAGLTLAVTIVGAATLYGKRSNNATIPMKINLLRSTISKDVTSENGTQSHHKLLIWMAAYNPLNQRDRYVLHHLGVAKNICESPTYNTSVRLFIATCSQAWHGTDSLREFINTNSPHIKYIRNPYGSSDDVIIIEHFT